MSGFVCFLHEIFHGWNVAVPSTLHQIHFGRKKMRLLFLRAVGRHLSSNNTCTRIKRVLQIENQNRSKNKEKKKCFRRFYSETTKYLH